MGVVCLCFVPSVYLSLVVDGNKEEAKIGQKMLLMLLLLSPALVAMLVRYMIVFTHVHRLVGQGGGGKVQC